MSHDPQNVELSGYSFDVVDICDFLFDDDLDCDFLAGGEVNGSFDFAEGAFSDSVAQQVVLDLRLTLLALRLTVHYSYNLRSKYKNIKTWIF